MDAMSQALLNKIAKAYPKLSKQGVLLAEFFQQDPLSAAQLSMAEIAEQTGVSKATISRFFRQIGYQSHQDLRKQLNQLRNKGYPVYQSAQLEELITLELEQFQASLKLLDLETVEKLVKKLIDASKITIIGYRNSYPVALHLREQLQQIRGNVHLVPLPGQTLSEELCDIEPDQLFIVVGYRRRPAIVYDILPILPKQQTVLLTDPSGAKMSEYVSLSLYTPLGDQTSLDSYSAVFSLISLISNRLMHFIGKDVDKRVASISRLFTKLKEF